MQEINYREMFHSIPGVTKQKVISITSGKGGVGKTLTTIHLAASIAQSGRKVLILDGDMGMANVDVVLGLRPRYNIRDVLDGQVDLDEVIVEGPFGVSIIPSGSGISQLQQLTKLQRQMLLDQFKKTSKSFDYIFIDTGAGIGPNVIHFNSIADQTIVVTTAEPHALTDAYAIMKVTHETAHVRNFGLIVNLTRSTDEGAHVASRLQSVVERFLNAKVKYFGSIPDDPDLNRAVLNRQVAGPGYDHTLAGQAWNKICHNHLLDSIVTAPTAALEFGERLLSPSLVGSTVNTGI